LRDNRGPETQDQDEQKRYANRIGKHGFTPTDKACRGLTADETADFLLLGRSWFLLT
jgi:hypothetical protein